MVPEEGAIFILIPSVGARGNPVRLVASPSGVRMRRILIWCEKLVFSGGKKTASLLFLKHILGRYLQGFGNELFVPIFCSQFGNGIDEKGYLGRRHLFPLFPTGQTQVVLYKGCGPSTNFCKD
jgi:hypothetical protein